MGSYTGGHNASRPQIDKRTTMINQNRRVALGRPAIKSRGGGGGGGGGLQLVCGRPTIALSSALVLVVWFAWKIPSS